MINLKDELKNFPKIDLEFLQNKNVTITEEIRNAVSLYNSAINKIMSNNTDIAIIQLKKAISIFPEFYDAILLLGACLFYTGNRIEAINIFNSIRDEVERKRAIAYLEELADRDARKLRLRISGPEKKTNEAEAGNSVNDNVQTSSNNNSLKGKTYFRKKKDVVSKIEPKGVFAYEKKNILDNPAIIKGMAYIAALLVLVCLFSWAVQAIRKIQMSDSPEFVELENKYKDEKDKAERYYKLYEDLKSKNSELYSKYILPVINEKYNARKFDELVPLLNLIDIEGFTDQNERNRVASIKKEVLNDFSDTAYSNGQYYYNQNNFNKAIEEFEKILKYHPEYNQIHWVLLNLGKSYTNIGENNKAIEIYDRLIREHSDTDAARQAVPLLNQLIEAMGLDRTPVVLPAKTPKSSAATPTSTKETMPASTNVAASPVYSSTPERVRTTAPAKTTVNTPGKTSSQMPTSPSPSYTSSPTSSPSPTQTGTTDPSGTNGETSPTPGDSPTNGHNY